VILTPLISRPDYLSQVKSFEADIVEAQGYKGAIAAADELKGLLEGSKAAGSRKGLSTEQQAAYSTLPQVRTECVCPDVWLQRLRQVS